MTARSRSDVIVTISIVVGVTGVVLALVGLFLGGYGSSGDKAQVIEQPLDLPTPSQAVTKPFRGESESPRGDSPSTAAGERELTSESALGATQQAPEPTSQTPSVAVVPQPSETPTEYEKVLEVKELQPGRGEQRGSESPARPAEGVAPASNQDQRVRVYAPSEQAASKREPVATKAPEPSSTGNKPAHKAGSPRKKISKDAGLRSKAWLLKQDPNHYTIQIMAVRRLQALKEYAVAQSIPLDLAYYRTRRDGKDYFVLVAGVFPSRDAARVAASKLPQKVRANNPWIRRIEAVKRSIN